MASGVPADVLTEVCMIILLINSVFYWLHKKRTDLYVLKPIGPLV